jgi:hypothetical protein
MLHKILVDDGKLDDPVSAEIRCAACGAVEAYDPLLDGDREAALVRIDTKPCVSEQTSLGR